MWTTILRGDALLSSLCRFSDRRPHILDCADAYSGVYNPTKVRHRRILHCLLYSLELMVDDMRLHRWTSGFAFLVIIKPWGERFITTKRRAMANLLSVHRNQNWYRKCRACCSVVSPQISFSDWPWLQFQELRQVLQKGRSSGRNDWNDWGKVIALPLLIQIHAIESSFEIHAKHQLCSNRKHCVCTP